MKTVMKGIAVIIAIVLVIAAVGIGVLTAAEYKPDEWETLTPSGTPRQELMPGAAVNIVSWNVGYGALGDNADFFMDGGHMVATADDARVRRNLDDIGAFLRAEEPDIILLQELDLNSERSHYIDERAALTAGLDGYASLFAYNFNALYVPFPVPPIGHVESGLLTLSSYPVAGAERVRLPCPFSWPTRLANLKRCLLVSRIPVTGTDRELVVFNLHLEAYDDGEGRAAQTAVLAELLKAEANKGNYVIAGGDFNQLFSSVDASRWPVRAGAWAPAYINAEAFGERFVPLIRQAVSMEH